MAYGFHHVHLKGDDPRRSAQWYVDMFGANPKGERDIRGALFVTVQLGGVTINVSSPRPTEKMAPGSAELHYGLEHIGFTTDNLEADLARLRQQGARVFEELTTPTGGKVAFIEGPDKVRIELLQL